MAAAHTVRSLHCDQDTSLPALVSPLQQEVCLHLHWEVINIPSAATVIEQICEIDLGNNHSLTFHLAPHAREATFRLPANTQFTGISVTIHCTVDRDDAFSSLPIQRPSAVLPEPETLKTFYVEYNTELRRTRTLYETFVIAVTAGFAILVSQAGRVISTHLHPCLIWIGVCLLIVIIGFLVWVVSTRYHQLSEWSNNLEIAVGMRSGVLKGSLIGPVGPAKWRPRGKDLWWAILLIVYTIVLGAASGVILTGHEKTDPTPVTNPTAAVNQSGPNPCPSAASPNAQAPATSNPASNHLPSQNAAGPPAKPPGHTPQR